MTICNGDNNTIFLYFKNCHVHYTHSKKERTISNSFWIKNFNAVYEQERAIFQQWLIIWQNITSAHWDFMPKFLSLHYYTTMEGVLGVQRSGQAPESIICLFGPLFFSQNGMTLKKPTKIIKVQWKVTVFWDIIRVCSILAEKQRPKPIRWT